MANEIKITGLEGVREALQQLPKEMRKKELNAALRKGANIIRDTAKNMAPVKTGRLRDHIGIRSEKKRYLYDAALLKVGVLTKKNKKGEDNPTPHYWRYVEFGTSTQRAQPFLAPAFELAKIPAFDAIQAHLRKRLPKIADKVRKK